MKYKIPNIPEGTGDKLIKAGLLVAAFFIGKNLLANKAKDSADSQLDTNPAAGQARALNAAMNPSGNNWMRSFDTTNTDAIYDIAAQITDLDKVRDFYKAFHKDKRNLNDDLESEIGAEGYQKFLALATKGKTGSTKYQTVLSPIPANRWVITLKEANIRKTAKLESRFVFNNNIVKLVDSGKAVGVTTGKFAYDEPNDVTFIEFFTLGAKKAGKHFFYVAKSQVELLTNDEKIKREKTQGKISLELLAGLAGIEEAPQTQAVSLRPTLIYDEQFIVLMTAPKNIIIGFPIMTLDTGKGIFTKVQTVEGNLRWIRTEDIRIENRL